jgi:hypothetical protein
MNQAPQDDVFDFSELVGFHELSPEEQTRVAAEIGMVLYKRALLTMLSTFTEAEQATFANFLDTLGEQDDMVAKTITQYPRLAEFLAEEAENYRMLAATVLDHAR